MNHPNIDAELIVFQNDVDLQIPASRLGRSKLNDLARIEGIQAVGPIGVSSAAVLSRSADGLEKINVALIGVEPGMPGAPPTYAGSELTDERAEEVVVDQHLLDRANIPVGSILTIKVIQGTEERLYELRVIGHTEGQFINFGPSIFVPLRVWDRVKPKERPGGGGGSDLIFNLAAVKLQDPASGVQMAITIEKRVNRVEVTDRVSTYEATQGFQDMQQIIATQQNFVLLIVLLIIGSFFQIQALQKVAQVGMLKAIGASNRLVSLSLFAQVMLTTIMGLLIGGSIMLILSQIIPPTIPIVFDGQKIVTAVVSLLITGPVAGLVAIRTLLKVEPLKALGLG
ncbi:ABC transporter permease [Chloroflexi bacterium TSY]|nr:ABC transporter permease [Chloroflexi bacterium TSY]